MPGRNKRHQRRPGSIVVGIDTGGTFTDLVAMIDGRLRVHKLPSTPHDPAEAVFRGLEALLEKPAGAIVTYSSTVATNTLLEKDGARVALVTDRGFEDLIEIGRQNRIELYALAPSRATPLITREMRFGVGGRTLFDGHIEEPLHPAELRKLRTTLEHRKVEAIAISMLHSYANPRTEQMIARALAPLGIPLSVSHWILPEYREYERLSTTVVNAYVAPRMVAHLEALEDRLGGSALRVMQSNGGAIGVALARAEPVRTILSGPAAGVVGAGALVRSLGLDRFITFDMGGTSTDVALFDRRAQLRTLSFPGGYPVRTPVIDIHTVGAGGGSLAAIDAGGSLKVGPESAGANPGPACYGRGIAPAVTDADLVAGRLVADNFLGGAMRLYPERAARALAGLGRSMKADAAAAARGVIRVVNANMERAIRVITVERGFDPRDFALLAFGGAGPMHACELALELGIRHVVMPRNPGLLCAWGALGAPLGRELSLTVRDVAPELPTLERRARPMIARARADLVAEGVARPSIDHELWADLRYRGQAYEIEVQLGPHFLRDFHERHRQTFGHATAEAPVEVVNLRVRAYVSGPAVALTSIGRSPKPSSLTRVAVLIGDTSHMVPVYARDVLGGGLRLNGPLIVVELSATTYVAPEFAMRLDDYGNIHLELR
jgi:N-methylhydantoinase A